MTNRQTVNSQSKGPSMVAPLALMMIVFVFGGIVGIASFQLRKDLRERVLQRYADIWGPISRFQVARGMDDELLSTLNLEDTIVYSLMEGQDIDGALGVQVFDSQGRYLAGVPAGIDEADLDLQESGQLRSHEPWGRLTEGNSSDRQQSELELFVPIFSDAGEDFGVVVRYLMEGDLALEEFGAIDEKLIKQASSAFLGGTLLVSGVFLWSFWKLRQARKEVELRVRRLASANAELAMVAKTSAIGAVASHLIHGLRNPLAGIREHVASEGKGLESDDWHDARLATKRMQSMINEVVDVLRNEEVDELETLTGREIGAYLERKYSERAAGNGLDFGLSIRGEVGLSARDGNIAKLIVSNLIENALDATLDGGEIEVRIEAAEESFDFTVLDTGSGFSENARKNLFNPVTTAKTSGAGIGLAISQQLARHIGADLELVRSSSSGTVLLLSVPSR
ncbi:MAG: HAMP domain-containing histidine kinase [Opitutales bacterium]|nr:HAMP domain-containing histidine kinase [Opitutales bacterium]MBT5816600.1 HAMP domain-containing histidine kinase [Opitutales bacterium]